MRRNNSGYTTHGKPFSFKFGTLIFALSAAISGQAWAQQSCNPDMDVTIQNPSRALFEGDVIRVSADIGAGAIAGGTHMDIHAFGYALNCEVGQNFANCTSAGNTVEFVGNMSTTCVDSAGNDVVWEQPESNVIPLSPVSGLPVRVGPNQQCNVQWDARIIELADDANGKIRQAIGWPIEGFPNAKCDNSLTTSASSTMNLRVQTCDIVVSKQVSKNNVDWFDANTLGDALELDYTDTAFYRLVVRNESTIDYVGDMRVRDAGVSVDTLVSGLGAGQEVEIGSGTISALTVANACSTSGQFSNTASVEGFCRNDNEPVSAKMEDVAWINCLPPPPADITIEKSTNGMDADSPTGPLIEAGTAVEWSFEVTNNGGQPITQIAVSDNLEGSVTCPKTELAASESMTCTPLVGTAAAGQYSNLATVTGTAFDSSAVSDTDPSHYFGVDADINIDKTASVDVFGGAGENITYTFVVTNTGNSNLTSVMVIDPLPGLSAIDCNWAGSSDNATPAGTLSPGETVSCTANYTTTVGDVAAGKVDNTATAKGTPPVGDDVMDDDPETVPYEAVVLEAAAICVNDAPWVEVDVTTFNLGNVPASDINFQFIAKDGSDEVVGSGDLADAAPKVIPAGGKYYVAWPDSAVTAGPDSGESGIAALDTLYGSAWPGWDLVDGVWVEIASNRKPTLDMRVFVNPEDTMTVTYPPALPDCVAAPKEDIKIEKTIVDVELNTENDTIEVMYRSTVSNNGGQAAVYTVEDTLSVSDSLTVASVVNNVEHEAGTEGDTDGDIGAPTAQQFNDGMVTLVEDETLQAGKNEAWTFTLAFSLDADTITVASADCVDDDGENGKTGFANDVDVLVDNQLVDEDDACDPIPLEPMIEILKQIKDGDDFVDADDANSAPIRKYPAGAEYQLIVRNIGPVDMENVKINDPDLKIVNYEPVGAGGAGKLAVGEEVIIGAGVLGALNASSRCDETENVENEATASGESTQDDSTATDSDSAWLKCVGTPSLLVEKKISLDGQPPWLDSAGPVDYPSGAYYQITVTNNGETKLVDVEVTDSLIPAPGKYTIGEMDPLEVVVVDSGKWSDLNMAVVCDGTADITNIATVTGESDENPADTVSETDSANLVCIGPPLVSIEKQVSVDGGQNWDDADGPDNLPSVVYDPDNPADIYYRFIVANVGTVDLVSVIVDDDELGIDQVEVGPIAVGADPVVIESGEISALFAEGRCDTTGEISNVVTVDGFSSTGNKHTVTNPAIFECTGTPKIEIVKLVSSDGVTWDPSSVNAEPPSDAYYRIEVTNTGTLDLVDVKVSDPILGLLNVVVTGAGGPGKLAVGETVVLVHEDTGNPANPNIVTDLEVPGLCQEGEEETRFPNEATAVGTVFDSDQTVDDIDTATFICEARYNFCPDLGRPDRLKMRYTGVDSDDNDQGSSYSNVVENAGALPETATIWVYNKTKNDPLPAPNPVSVTKGNTFFVYDPRGPGKIPPNVIIEIYDGSTLLRTITFHGSCSAPLAVGESYGATKIVGVDHDYP